MGKKKKSVDELLEEALVPKEEQPYEVPGNWVWTRIENTIKPMETREPKKLDGEVFNYIDVDAIDNKKQTVRQVKQIEITLAPSRAKRKVSKGDVIISLVRPYLKNIAHIEVEDNKLVVSTAFYVCTPKEILKANYLYRYLCTNYATQYLIDHTRGDNSPSVRSTDYEKMPIPIPPIYEQKRIAEKLERLINKIDEAECLIKEAKESFEIRRAAILNKAFRGELTKEWRKDTKNTTTIDLNSISEKKDEVYKALLHEAKIKGIKKPAKPKKFKTEFNDDYYPKIPSNWIYCTLGEIVYDFKYGTSEKSDYLYKGTPVIRIPNIGEEFINTSDLKYLNNNETMHINSSVKKDDILIVRSNGSKDLVGKCSIVTESESEFAFASYLIRLRPIMVDSKYVLWLLKSENVRNQLFSKSKSSAGINNINTEELATTVIPIPSIEEQKEIVNKIEKLVALERDSLLELQVKIEEIKQSILTRAFKGELGTNDPLDENAIELIKDVLKEQVN
ncbi:restriction endonuclease subunit S [Bacillus sp. D386]|uniref:restriction endonuclease subunit S n=1 Tax=Bacillus sp. D386 TaxID=2587155 RepID=UPI001124B7C8|nr:restriction endonuclease subunit S [Bacillus sp. D386]